MRINFEDHSYVEFNKSMNGKINIILSARDGKNSLNNIINSVEISSEQMMELILEMNLDFKKMSRG